MKIRKTMLAAALAAAVFMPIGNVSEAAAGDNAGQNVENVQMTNPWTDYQTKKEAEKASGIRLKAPNKYIFYKLRDVRAMTEKAGMLELVYTSTQGKNDYADTMTIRKAKGKCDISGDYGQYEFTRELNVGKRQVTVKGNGEYMHLATWQEGEYAYSVQIDGGLTQAELVKLIKKIR